MHGALQLVSQKYNQSLTNNVNPEGNGRRKWASTLRRAGTGQTTTGTLNHTTTGPHPTEIIGNP